MPEAPCLFENQTAVFLKCAEIDCALESAKKPRTAGLCGRTAGACDCGPLSCSTIEWVNKGRKPPKQGMAGRETSIPKGSVSHCRSRMHRTLSHIAHKRRNARFNGLRRVHTCLRQQDRTQRLTRRNRGRFGWGRYHYPRSVPHVSETLRGQGVERQILLLLGLDLVCSRRTQRAFGTAIRSCASLFRGVAAPLGCVIPLLFPSPHRRDSRFWLSMITARREHICRLHTLVCSMRLATRCRSFALSTASICRW